LQVKQIFSIKGLSARQGSLHQPKHIIYNRDCEVVHRLRAAGAIPLLISNTPEISCGYETYNFITGRTRNPYNLSLTSGGSSGGEAALISTNSSVFGIASDTAGSIRLPCHFTGICGHKPTPGFIPKTDVYPIFKDPYTEAINCVGPMSRTISNLKILMKVLTNNAKDLKWDEKISPENVKVLYARSLAPRFVMNQPDRDIQELIDTVALKLSKKHDVKPWSSVDEFYSMPEVTNERITCRCKHNCILQTKPVYLLNPTGEKAPIPNAYLEYFKSWFGLSKFTFSVFFFEALRRWRGGMYYQAKFYRVISDIYEEKFHKLLANDIVLILPTYTTTATLHYGTYFRPGDATYIGIANAFGLPCTQVPVGFSKNGLPIGLQVIGGPKQDRLTLEIAQEIQELMSK